MPNSNRAYERRNTKPAIFSVIALLALSIAPSALRARQADQATPAQLQAIRDYIKQSWHTLERSNARLAEAAVDPKFKSGTGSRWPVYVSRKEKLSDVEAKLRKAMPAADFEKIELRQLPEDQS